MKGRGLKAIGAALLVCVLVWSAGCAGQSALETEKGDWLFSAEPQYLSEWPDNEFTRQIPQPQHGTVEYVVDYSSNGRYNIVITGITGEESAAYVEELKTQGYIEMASEDNEVSAGTMLKRDNVVLNVAYSVDEMNVLITVDEAF